MVEHLGGEVLDRRELGDFVAAARSFEGLATQLYEARAPWVKWDPFAACVADRSKGTDSVGQKIAWACQQTAFNCENIPKNCLNSDTVWLKADYIFSVYYNLKQG